MRFNINGRSVEVLCDVRTSLLDLLRDHLGRVPKKVVTKVPAAPVQSWLTVFASTHAWPLPFNMTATHHHDRGLGECHSAASAATGVCRLRWVAVRILHARSDLFRGCHGR